MFSTIPQAGKHVLVGGKVASRSFLLKTTTTTTPQNHCLQSVRSHTFRKQPPLQHHHHCHNANTNRTLVLHESRQAAKNPSRRSKSTTTTTTTTTAALPPPSPEKVPEPSFRALQLVAITQSIPFIGFGFMDNAILIVAGDAIDTRLGVVFGMSTLCAAAIGNIISDLAGIGLGTMIEDFCANHLKLPVPNLTTAQRQLRSVRFAGQLGMAFGMTFGCIVGMFPLLFIDSDKIAKLKQKAKLEALFRDVVTEAKTLVHAESTILYLRVDDNPPSQKGKKKKASSTSASPYKPNVEGEYLYAMFYDVPKNTPLRGITSIASSSSSSTSSGSKASSPTTTASSSTNDSEELSRIMPIGKGIVSRAMLTGLAWKIDNVHAEPDFYPASKDHAHHMKQMLVVPVLDSQGRAIAAIRAMNKVVDSDDSSARRSSSSRRRRASKTTTGNKNDKDDDDEGEATFTDQDVLILKSLASHISVSLQSMYQDEQDEDTRLRDTIRILKEHGIEGLPEGKTRRRQRSSLFPDSE